MEAFDSKGIINTPKRYYVSHTMSCLLCKFISPGACPLRFPSIFHSFRQENKIVELFYWSKFRDRKENEVFESQAKNALKHARITPLIGK